jgi:hypothetical protein
VGRKCLLVDEAWKYVNVRKHPVELERAVRGGRHVELDCLFTTQTPGQLHETIRNECTELVCFALRDEKSLEFPPEPGPGRGRDCGPAGPGLRGQESPQPGRAARAVDSTG